MSAVREEIRTSRFEQQSVRLPQQQDGFATRGQAKSARRARIANRISLGVCCAISFSIVWMVASKGATVYQESFQNTKLQTQVNEQSATNATLNATVAQLKRPSRILQEALNKLHMQYKKPLTIPADPAGK